MIAQFTSLNVVDILQLGFSGLAFLLAWLSYSLLVREQARDPVRVAMLVTTIVFMMLCLVLAGGAGYVFLADQKDEISDLRKDLDLSRTGEAKLASMVQELENEHRTRSTTSLATMPSAPSGTLIIDKVVMHETPQSGSWLYCFRLQYEDRTVEYHIPGKKFEGDGLSIPMDLRLDKVPVGATVSFTMTLEDDQAKICTSAAEDLCTGLFGVTQRGALRFQTRDDWAFTLYWHIE
jgi:hypothetical protein